MVLVLDELVHSWSSLYSFVGCAVQPRKRFQSQLLLMMNLLITATAAPAPTASSIAVMLLIYDTEIVEPGVFVAVIGV